MVAPLADIADVKVRLARELTDVESLRVGALLDDASARFRLEAGQAFTPATSSVTLPVRNSRVRLPQRPVTAVGSVVDVSGNELAGWTWDEAEFVYLPDYSNPLWSFAFEPYRTPRSTVTVTYTHGSATIPPVVVATVAQMAARALSQSADQTGLTQESIDGYSYSVGSAAASGGAGMLASELEVARSFRRPSVPISMR